MKTVQDIPIPKIPIKLKADTPSRVTPEELKAELNSIGLYCSETRVENLRRYIDETVKQFPDGGIQGFGMFEYDRPKQEELLEKGYTSRDIWDIAVPLNDIHNNWQPYDIAPYMAQLSDVGYPEHFDYLMKHYMGFSGVKSGDSDEGEGTTADAIKNQFVKIATDISSVLIKDLNKYQMEATFKKIIKPVDPGSSDYDSGVNNRCIFLVDGYDGTECRAIGVLNVEYHLIIKNYKEKKSAKTNYSLDVTIRTALYTDTDELEKQDIFLKTHFKGNLFFGMDIPLKPEVKIYGELPPEAADTFIHSLPLEQTDNDSISVMVFYAPDLQNIGCIDNTDSAGSAQYSKTVTSGFTFTFGQKIAGGAKYAAGVMFQKAELSVNIELSLTEQWNSSQSETISFSVPSKSKAFLYQGYLQCAVLEYNMKNFKYSYKQKGRFMTNMIKTAPVPSDAKPSVIKTNEKTAENTKPPLWERL